MGAWIGLAGVVAGAMVAFISQYLVTNSQFREQRDALLLEQLSVLVALSEDYRGRVWQERHKLTMNVTAAWDLGAYRLAEAKLQILCQDSNVLSALAELSETGNELGKAWMLSPEDEARTKAAWDANRAAIQDFITASSKMFRRARVRHGRSSVLAIPPIGAP